LIKEEKYGARLPPNLGLISIIYRRPSTVL
jgi:hypothetical protein